MHKDLLDILACPMCKAPLDLTSEEERGQDVVKGYLTCVRCGERYPIEDSIPNLLPPYMRQSVS